MKVYRVMVSFPTRTEAEQIKERAKNAGYKPSSYLRVCAGFPALKPGASGARNGRSRSNLKQSRKKSLDKK